MNNTIRILNMTHALTAMANSYGFMAANYHAALRRERASGGLRLTPTAMAMHGAMGFARASIWSAVRRLNTKSRAELGAAIRAGVEAARRHNYE